MPARYSAFLAQRRRAVLLTAAAVALLLMALSTVLPGLDLVVLGGVVALTLLGLASRDSRTDEFVLVDGSFATVRGSVPVTWAVADLGFAAVVFAEGVREVNAPWAPWLTLLAAYLLPLVVCGSGLWHGIGITLTPDGLRADKLTGAIFVPWAALSADQFAPTPGDDGHLILRYAHPGQVRKFGFPIDLDRVSFTHTSSDFAAAAIRHYLAHPDRRPAIGTPAGLAALAPDPALDSDTVVTPAPADPPLPPPPSPRRRARNALAGAALMMLAIPLWLWTEDTLDLPGAEQPLGLAVLAGLALLVSAAFPRANRPAPASVPSLTPSRAPWARDVTR